MKISADIGFLTVLAMIAGGMIAGGSSACARTVLDRRDAGRPRGGDAANPSSETNTPASGGGRAATGGDLAEGAGSRSTAAGGAGGWPTGWDGFGVPCGKARCGGAIASSIPGLMLAEVCCVDPVTEQCGTRSTQTQLCELPPPPAPKCPDALQMPGCCAAGNVCGVDASSNGRGCLDQTTLVASIPPQFRKLITLPPPAHCDGSPIVALDGGVAIDGDAGH